MEKEGWREVEEWIISSIILILWFCIPNAYAVSFPMPDPLLPSRHIFMQTWVLLYIVISYKSKHLCAIWMCPALKFDPYYQSWQIMITKAKIRFKRRFYALSYHGGTGAHSRFWSGCCKMHMPSALGVSSLQLIFLFQLLLWVDKIHFNIFVLRVLSRERGISTALPDHYIYLHNSLNSGPWYR